jgi:hypothetical protein
MPEKQCPTGDGGTGTYIGIRTNGVEPGTVAKYYVRRNAVEQQLLFSLYGYQPSADKSYG